MNFWRKSRTSTLRKKCPYSEIFWSAFSRIRNEYGESVQMRENADQNNSENGHFLSSVTRKITHISNNVGAQVHINNRIFSN